MKAFRPPDHPAIYYLPEKALIADSKVQVDKAYSDYISGERLTPRSLRNHESEYYWPSI
jgi:hypothetical protein